MTPVVRVKANVEFAVISPAGFALLAAIHAAAQHFGMDLTITCGTEGHPDIDPHTTGAAYDLSVQGLNDPQIIDLVLFLRETLGPRFYVTYETPNDPRQALVIADVAVRNLHATAPHLHLQRRKNTTYPPNTSAA